MSERPETLALLIQRSVHDILSWLDALQSEQIKGQSDFNWLGLAEAASANSLRNPNQEESLAWARVATFAYERLLNNSMSAIERGYLLVALMNLMASLVVKYGAVEDDKILDPRHVTELFSSNVPLNYEEAARQASVVRKVGLRKSAIGELQILRRIKNLLAPLVLLDAHGYIEEGSPYKNWVSLREALP